MRKIETGAPIRHHSKKLMWTPSCSRMKASPITFGGVPIGVARPPIDAANATQRNKPVANSGFGQGKILSDTL